MGPFIKVLTTLVRLRPSITALRCYSGEATGTFTTSESIQPYNSTNQNITLPGHIYFVATPIGNLLDISERAKLALTEADYICAEDTRHTGQLLNLLKIKPRKLISHHEHNYLEQIPKIIDLAKQGQSIAVVSDAGTPGISDPGAQLAEACFKAGVPVHPIPGSSAVVAALSVCGFPSSEFSFFGFIDVKGKERAAKLARIANTAHTAVFFEAPHRIVSTLSDLTESYGQGKRECVYCREITKLHEEIVRSPLEVCLATLRQRESSDDKVDATIDFCSLIILSLSFCYRHT